MGGRTYVVRRIDLERVVPPGAPEAHAAPSLFDASAHRFEIGIHPPVLRELVGGKEESMSSQNDARALDVGAELSPVAYPLDRCERYLSLEFIEKHALLVIVSVPPDLPRVYDWLVGRTSTVCVCIRVCVAVYCELHLRRQWRIKFIAYGE